MKNVLKCIVMVGAFAPLLGHASMGTYDLVKSSKIVQTSLNRDLSLTALKVEKTEAGSEVILIDGSGEKANYSCEKNENEIDCGVESDEISLGESRLQLAERSGLAYFQQVYRMINLEDINGYEVFKKYGDFYIKYNFTFRGKDYSRYLYCHQHSPETFDCHKKDERAVPEFPRF